MRILIISQYAFPEPNAISSKLACKFAERGHEVFLITGLPNYPGGKIYSGYKNTLYRWEFRDGCRILRVPLFPYHGKSWILRALHYASFALSASLIGCFLVPKPDAIWGYHPPVSIAIPLSILRTRFRVPVVLAVHDLWPDFIVASGIQLPAVLIKLIDQVARWVYRRADAITAVSESIALKLRERVPCPEKVQVVFNSVDLDLFKCDEYVDKLKELWRFENGFRIVFGGMVGLAQGLDTVLEAAIHLQEENIHFVIIGDGPEKSRLEEFCRHRSIKNLRFIPTQTEVHIPSFFALADALLLQLVGGDAFHGAIPSKFQTYLAAGKPILCGVPGETSDIVIREKLGFCYDGKRPSSLAQAASRMAKTTKANRLAFGSRARKLAETTFSLETAVTRHEDILRKVANRKAN
jgi:glycosyltransferase involved in cell wall biosynthesis